MTEEFISSILFWMWAPLGILAALVIYLVLFVAICIEVSDLVRPNATQTQDSDGEDVFPEER